MNFVTIIGAFGAWLGMGWGGGEIAPAIVLAMGKRAIFSQAKRAERENWMSNFLDVICGQKEIVR